jgi:hypothetical protein
MRRSKYVFQIIDMYIVIRRRGKRGLPGGAGRSFERWKDRLEKSVRGAAVGEVMQGRGRSHFSLTTFSGSELG